MNAVNGLATISQAKELLRTANLDQAIDLRDKAEAVRIYLKAAGDSLDAQNHAAEIRLRAERHAGAILAKMERKSAGRPKKNTDTPSVLLSDLGITDQQSSRWQRVAAIPEKAFEEQIATAQELGGELTQAGMLRLYGKLNKPNNPVPPATGTDGRWTIVKAMEELNSRLAAIREQWPVEYFDVMARKLRAFAEELDAIGGQETDVR